MNLGHSLKIKAIAWRWGEYCPLPPQIDIAYKLQENNWQGVTNIELELVGVRLAKESKVVAINRQIKTNNNIKKGKFDYNGKTYACSLWQSLNELRIKNEQGKVLAIKKGDRFGLLGTTRDNAQPIDVTKPPYFHLIKTAIATLQE